MASREYRIHPGIGVARLGNSTKDGEEGYFIGPEAPGVVPIPGGPYKDGDDMIRRQGARFRIYEYSYDDSGKLTGIREITADDAEINWIVHLVNKKAAAERFPPGGQGERNPGVNRADLTIDAGNQSITGVQQVTSLSGSFRGTGVALGNLRTDAAGRLIVLGGFGTSKSVPAGKPVGAPFPADFANNPGWHDDVSDGSVTATIELPGEAPVQAESAWVVVASPSYAPAINNVTTWYDQALNVAVQLDPNLIATSEVSFTRDIYPILRRTVTLQWVSRDALRKHGDGEAQYFLDTARLAKLASSEPAERPARQFVFDALRNPDDPGGGGSMPKLNRGLDPANPTGGRIRTTLTQHQYDLMERWSEGQFEADWQGEPPTPAFDDIPVPDQPAALDRAALDACIGGPFFPGIESGYIMALLATYEGPFRISNSKVPGDLTAGLAVPWQADYIACARLWWPAQRPNWVLRNGGRATFDEGIDTTLEMVEKWWQLGFILRDGNQYVEKERNPAL